MPTTEVTIFERDLYIISIRLAIFKEMRVVSGTAASNVLINSHGAGHHSCSFLDDFNMKDLPKSIYKNELVQYICNPQEFLYPPPSADITVKVWLGLSDP